MSRLSGGNLRSCSFGVGNYIRPSTLERLY